jgi:alpha-1,2-mannosyltransferase
MRPAAAAIAATILLAVATLLIYQHDGGWMYDAKVYRTAGNAVLRGLDLYSPARGQHFTYTPFAAVLFAPLSVLPATPFALLWTALSIACLGGGVWLSLAWIGVASGRRRFLLTAAICLLSWAGFEPVSFTLLLGQVNLILMFVVLYDLWLPDQNHWKGLGIGVAAGIKLIPAFFIVYLLVTRRWRAAAAATAAGAATVGIGFLAAPASSLEYWGGVFLQSGRVGDPQNVRSQSLQSLLVRWLHTTQGMLPLWLVLSLAIAALALALAMIAHRRGDELLAICVCGLATTLVSPITWQHHWVWMLPLLLWLAARARRDRSKVLWAVAAVVAVEFYVRPYMWGVPVDPTTDLHLNLVQLLLASTYAITAAALLVLAARHLIDPPPHVNAVDLNRRTAQD